MAVNIKFITSMKKIVAILLTLTMSCASTFGTPGNQSDTQRKNDKIVSRLILGTLIVGASLIVINNYEN